MSKELSHPLTSDESKQLNVAERIVANAMTQKPNLRVESQIPVGHSVIDLKVTNLVNPQSVERGGKLVEVTHTEREAIKSHVAKKGDDSSEAHKQKQVKDMENSGLPYTILGGKEVAKIGTKYGTAKDLRYKSYHPDES